MQKRAASFLPFLACAGLMFLLSSSSASAEEKIKIGVSVPLTGSAAAYGTDIKNALLFANKAIGNSAYELIIEDDQCLDKEAVTIAHKMVDVHKVKYALGFGCSGTVLAAAPVYESGKVVVIASGTGAPAITNAGDYIFRTKPTLNIAADLLAKEFAAKFQKVGAITEETAFAQGLTNATVKAANALKVEIINENFLPGSEDFRATLLRLKSKGAQAVFFNPQGEPGLVNIFKQFRALDWKVPVYGVFIPGSPVFTSAFGKDGDGVIYADLEFNQKMLNEEGRKLFAEFEKEYGKPQSAEHYSALTLVAYAAMDEAIRSGKDVKDYLYNTTFHKYVNNYSFDKNGDVVSDSLTYTLKVLKEQAPVPYLMEGTSAALKEK